MPDVKMPDGTVVRFPDDMPPDQIKSLILKKFPRAGGPTNSAAEDYTRAIGSGAWRGLSTVGGFWGDIQRGADVASQAAIDLGHDVIFGKRSPEAQAAHDAAKAKLTGYLPAPPTSANIKGGIETVMPGSVSYQPQRSGAKLAQAGTEGAVAAGALSGGGSVGNVVDTAIRYGAIPRVAGKGAVLATGQEGKPLEPWIETGAALGAAGVGAALPRPRYGPATPSTEELRNAATQGFDASRNMNVSYHSGEVQRALGQPMIALEADGIVAQTMPKTLNALRIMDTTVGPTVPIARMMAARAALRRIAATEVTPTGGMTPDGVAAQRILGTLDNFLATPPAAAVASGPATQAGQVYGDARANYAAAKRSEQLFGIDRPAGAPSYGLAGAATLRANAANSGMNLDNSIRSKVASLLLNPKKAAGYSPAEIGMMEEVANGTAGRNTLRLVGNLLGGGGGLGAVASGAAGGAAGLASGGPIGAAIGAVGVPVAGVGAKALANRLTTNALQRADEAIRQRSPLFLAQPGGAAVGPQGSRQAALLAWELLHGRYSPAPATPIAIPAR